MEKIIDGSLKNHFLLAMPGLSDSTFAKTLIYLVEHNSQGAMGLVVNRPKPLPFSKILGQLFPQYHLRRSTNDMLIYSGGPVEPERGFVLHPEGVHFQSTTVFDAIALSTSQDALLSIANQHIPHNYLIALGYSGWSAGQLEREIQDNAWLVCPFDKDILFHTDSDQRLQAAAGLMGINLSLLCAEAGHA